MKYLKKFFESNSDDIIFQQSEIDEIMDVFQDLIDEYNIEIYSDTGDSGISYNLLGYLFAEPVFDKSEMYQNHYIKESNRLSLRVFAPIKEAIIIPFPDEKIILLKELNQ